MYWAQVYYENRKLIVKILLRDFQIGKCLLKDSCRTQQRCLFVRRQIHFEYALYPSFTYYCWDTHANIRQAKFSIQNTGDGQYALFIAYNGADDI